MGRPKTLEHQLEQAKADIEELKYIISEIGKGWPSYIHSFTGVPIFLAWCRRNNLSTFHMRVLIYIRNNRVLSHKDVSHYGINRTHPSLKKWLAALVAKGLVQVVGQPVQMPKYIKQRKAYILTPKGQALEDDYHAYYDQHISKASVAAKLRMARLLKQKENGATRAKFSGPGRPRKVY